MHKIVVVLACLTCAGHGRRVKHKAGNTTSSSLALEQSQSNALAGVPLKPASLSPALSHPAATFASQSPRVFIPSGLRSVTGQGHKLSMPSVARTRPRRLPSVARMSQMDDSGNTFPSNDSALARNTSGRFKNLTWILSNKDFAQKLCGLDSKQRPRALFFYDGG